MRCDDYLKMNGVKLGYTDDTVTITEVGYGRKAVLDNNGNVISSTFPKASLPFVDRYFKRFYPEIEAARAFDDQERGHAGDF